MLTEKNNDKHIIKDKKEALKSLLDKMEIEFSVLRSLIPKNLEAQTFPYLMILLNTMRDLLGKFSFPNDEKVRENIENAANEELQKMSMVIENEIRDYMKCSAEARNVKSDDIFSNIDEVNRPNEFDILFRYSRSGNIENLKLQVQMPDFPNSKHLRVFFEYEEQIKLLKYAFPMIKFINQVLSHYKLKIDRARAKQLKIKDFLATQENSRSFEEFKEAWEEFTKSEKFVWQLECHPLEKKQTFNEDDDLAFILADKQELGFGMYAYTLLDNIIRLQNTILREINKNQLKMKQENIIPLQKTTEKQLLGLSEEDFQEIKITIMRNSCCHLDYGKGSLISYNYQMLNNYIFETIFKGKTMLLEGEEAIISMQYQYEMTPNNIISKVREKTFQKSFYEKDFLIHKIELQKVPDISIFFQNLELLIFLLANMGEAEIQIYKEAKLSNFIENLSEKFRIDERFLDFCKRQQLLIKNILAFFEIVETFTYYRKILEKISLDYQSELSQNEKDDLEKFCNELEGANEAGITAITKYHVADAIRRYICRNLVGSNKDNKQKLRDFILFLDNLWPEELSNKVEDYLIGLFPESITLSVAVASHKFLRNKQEIELFEKKPENIQQKKNDVKNFAQPNKPKPMRRR